MWAYVLWVSRLCTKCTLHQISPISHITAKDTFLHLKFLYESNGDQTISSKIYFITCTISPHICWHQLPYPIKTHVPHLPPARCCFLAKICDTHWCKICQKCHPSWQNIGHQLMHVDNFTMMIHCLFDLIWYLRQRNPRKRCSFDLRCEIKGKWWEEFLPNYSGSEMGFFLQKYNHLGLQANNRQVKKVENSRCKMFNFHANLLWLWLTLVSRYISLGWKILKSYRPYYFTPWNRYTGRPTYVMETLDGNTGWFGSLDQGWIFTFSDTY